MQHDPRENQYRVSAGRKIVRVELASYLAPLKVTCLHVVMAGTYLLGLSLCLLEASADDPNRSLRQDVEALHRQSSPDLDARKKVSTLEQEVSSGQETYAYAQRDRTRTHIKMTGGLPFPLSEHVVLEPKEGSVTVSDDHFVEALRVFELPSRCDQNRTDREDISSLVLSGTEETLLDSLYLREEWAPVDASEVFGEKTKVFPVGQRSNPGVLYRMRADEVPCIPFRIRVTSRAIYRDRGENALRNYDRDPADRGANHPWIARKIFDKNR